MGLIRRLGAALLLAPVLAGCGGERCPAPPTGPLDERGFTRAFEEQLRKGEGDARFEETGPLQRRVSNGRSVADVDLRATNRSYRASPASLEESLAPVLTGARGLLSGAAFGPIRPDRI